MSTFMHAESRRLYSWWWDSHISPKNSKWLQENLTDMDLKVKAMIKLIEEDADSFARRAEMYYKKRPELMKFVEDFYRAYRALAERYDHATGALRHAHRTIAEAFPNHIPLTLPDESPCISPGTEIGPCTPEIPSPLCSLLDPDDLQKDAYAEENESFATKKGLKQLNELFAPWEATNRVKLHEGKVRKGLKFQEGEDGASPSKVHESKILLEQEVKEKENARNEIKRLQEEVSQLSIENQKLKAQIESESTNFDSSRSEVQNLRDAIAELQSEKEAAFLQDRLSGMETEILNANYEFDKLHEEMMLEIIKFCFVEEQCFSLDKANQSLELELEQSNKVLGELRALLVEKAVEKDNAKNEIKRFHEQLSLISNENKSLKIQLLSETEHLQLSRAEAQSMRGVLSKLESEKEAAVLMNQILQKSVSSLEAENIQARDEIGMLYAEILMGVVNLCTAEEQYLALAKAYQMLKLELEDRKRVLEEIQMLSVESQNLLEQEVKEKENIKNEIECLQGEISQLSIDNQNMKSQIVSKAMHLDAYRTEVQNLRNAVSILEREKEDAAFKNELSLKSMSSLESEICRGKDEIRKLHEEVLMGIVKLYGAEEQNFALENACQNLKVEIEVRKTMFEDLRISLQESENQRMEAERSLKSSERLYNLSQEKVAHATLEIQTHSEKLKDIEHSKMVLEEEVRQLEYVNYDLNEHIIAYDSKLKLLQDEIISLKEVNRKLEDEMSLHFEDRKVRQQELDSVKDDRDELDLKHKALIEQMEVASLNMESLEILIKELQFGCSELKEGCRKLEDEKLLLFNKLLDMETISERNTVLEISLSDAMEKIRVLEDFCESLNAKDSTHVVEKAALFSQNSLLENCLADANTELEVLRSKSKELEESSQFLSAQNSNLLLQKNALISQIEDIHYSLSNLATKYARLEFNHLNLEEDVSVAQGTELEDSSKITKKEHESLIQSCKIYFLSLENQIHLLQEDGRFKEEELEAVNQEFMRYITEVLVLQSCLCDMKDSLRTENQKYESLMQSGEIQLAALECQINLMQEKAQVRDREFEEQQQNYMNSILEIFILQRCLSEMKEKNFVLLNECREHTEASRRAGELISQLEGSKQLLKEENAALVDQNVKLVERCEKLGQDVNEKEHTNSSLKAELESLCRLLSDLSKNFSELRDEKSALEEENNVLLEGAVALEHLHLFFRSSNAENLQSLKVLHDAIDSLASVKNDHERQIRESEKKLKLAEYENGRLIEASLILLEELGSRTTMLEYDLSTARHFCDELMLEVEIGENLLEEKSMELVKAYHKLQCTQVEVTELCAKLGAAANEVDEAKTTRLQFEEKVAGLLEAHACKDVEISVTHEENRMLNEELNRWNRKFEALRKREQYLSSELQKKICELDMCEGEATDLLINIHFSQVNGAVLEDKIFEWGVAYEGLEICALVQREMLIQEITLRNAHAFELQKKLDDLEKENSKLKAIWNSCSPLFISLENGIANVENQAHQLANVHEDQNISSTDPQEKKSNETGKGDLVTIAGVLELQNLVSKLKEIENLMLNSNHQLKQERLLYASSLESARREIEDLKLEASDEQVKQGKESSVGKDGQMMKDIELDRASNSIVPSRIQSAESEDQMLKLWETAEIDYNNSVGHDIEGAPEFKSEQHSSEIVAEKEVGVDRLEISKEMKESQEDWNRRVIERLSIGGEKLSALKPTAQKLGAKLERSGKRERRKCSEHDAMQAKLKQVEEGIPSLFDTDGKLRKKLEEHSTFSNGERMGWLERRQVWEQVLMVMDQIEKFELELQEVQYYFAKLDEEAERNGTREGDRTPPQVLLRDYIKGWRVGQGRKGGRICGCIRPKTRE